MEMDELVFCFMWSCIARQIVIAIFISLIATFPHIVDPYAAVLKEVKHEGQTDKLLLYFPIKVK